MIAIVDYGMGNLGSIQNMLRRIGHDSFATSDIEQINSAEKLILPGVGAFDSAMRQIDENGLRAILNQKALVDRIPVLGICLGMQLLTNGSEEGKLPGLGWINAKATKIPNLPGLKVPHMGWDVVRCSTPSPLTKQLGDEPRFYFVHSYRVVVNNQQNSALKATHGIEFDAAIGSDNIYGVQFHPEKSHRFGMALLKNFAEI